MDDLGRAIFAGLMLVAAIGAMVLPDAVDQAVESVIVDPSENERLMGMKEKLLAAQ